MEPERTLADDELQLAAISSDLEQALVKLIPSWLRRSALAVAPGIDDVRLDATIAGIAGDLVPELARVLHADVDAGMGNPLAAVRAATAPLTQLLVAFGAPVRSRDPFNVGRFPDDAYELGPAAFADIDEALHEPGLMWGAARAHVHLRRRREAES